MRGLLVLIILFSSVLHAETFGGFDIDPFVEHFRNQVVVLTKPVTTFNWSPISANTRPPTSPEERLGLVQNLVSSFWRFYGRVNTSNDNVYGLGFYMAADPVASFLYRFGGRDWRLIQLQLSVGMRMLDIGNEKLIQAEETAEARATQDVERKFDCPLTLSPMLFFRNGGAYRSASCRALVQHVFNDILKIDVLAYDWASRDFRSCTPSDNQGRAFVVLRADAIQAEDAHLMFSNSQENKAERRLIETIFLEYEDPDAHLQEISKTTADLLWPDLAGKASSSGALSWLRNNKFACDGQLPYRSLTTGN